MMDYGQQLAVMYTESRRPDLKDKLIKQYLELVYSRAHVYTDGHNFDELVAAGMVALNTTAERYNPKAGKFITIATEFINGYMLHYMRDNKSCIKNPTNVESDAYYYVKKLAECGYTPQDEVDLGHLAKKLGVERDKLEKGREAYRVRVSTVDFSSLASKDLDTESSNYDLTFGLEGLWTNIDGSEWDTGPDKEEVLIMAKVMSYHNDGMTASRIARKLNLSEDLVKRCVKECTLFSTKANVENCNT